MKSPLKPSDRSPGRDQITTAVSPIPGRVSRALPSFYTIEQVAEALAVSTRTVRRWATAGLLPTHRFNGLVRIADRDLLAFVAIHRDG
jgi:excisionase family DNA binding protein